LIRARRRQPGLAQTVLIALFLALMSLAVVGALVRGS
jgi:hypothetical protein